MVRVQTGDAAAFQLLMTRHVSGLHRFAQRLLRSAIDADDITQETLLRIWQHAASWQPDRVRFTTWLYRIAHNLCVDRLRRAVRSVPSSWHDNRQLNGSDSATAATFDTLVDEHATREVDGIAQRERQRRVRGALAALPERQRTALALSFYQGFSNADAAAILDISVDALESLLSRARRTLRADLVEYAQGDQS